MSPVKSKKKSPAKAKRGGRAKSDSYHHGDLRAALLKAGLEILNKEGAHSLSLRDVARRVGVSHMAPYRHFPDKEALMAAIALEGFVALGEKVRAAVTPHAGNPATQLEEAAIAYVDFALDDTEHLRVMFGGFFERASYPSTREAATSVLAGLEAILQACQETGLVRKEPVERQAVAAWASVHGITLLLVEKQLQFLELSRDQAKDLVRYVARTVIAGMRP